MKLGDWQRRERESAAAIEAGDPTAFLLADHNWLRSVVARAEPLLQAPGGPAAEVRDGLQELKASIDRHLAQEEDLYFPALEPSLDAAGLAVELQGLLAEHDVIRLNQADFLQALAKGPARHEFGLLQRALLSHFANEEETVFDEAPGILSPEEARRLTEAMRRL